MRRGEVTGRIVAAALFAAAFAFVEASVVVYLRSLYPGGIVFPLQPMLREHLVVELAREASTLLVLGSAAWLAGARPWERFSYFLVLFGIWDIFYYVWLKVVLDWPASLSDWDVLFLIPLPWIGPVVAPVLISLFMVIVGIVILLRPATASPFRPSLASWVLSSAATACILFSFMQDTGATLHGALPAPYRYELLIAGLLLYAGAFGSALIHSRPRKV